MDVVVYDKIGKESDRLENLLLATFPQKTITDAPIASFADGAEDIPIKSLSVAIEPVQEGSGDPSPVNIRPISGHTKCDVERAGSKNLLPISVEAQTIADVDYTPNPDSTITVNGTASANSNYYLVGDDNTYIDIGLMPGTYILSGGISVAYLYVAAQGKQALADTGAGITFTVAEGDLFRIFIRVASGRTATNLLVKPMIRLASDTDPTFEAYRGHDTYHITFPSGTGTVYGGNITVNQDGSGSLVVDKATANLGSLSWSKISVTSSGRWYFKANINDLLNQTSRTASLLCSSYMTISDGRSFGSCPDKCIYNMSTSNTYGSIGVIDMSYETLESFSQAVVGVQLVYSLASPISIPLTAPQITTLLGQNNLWADTGNIKSLTYRANLGDYINNAITTAVANALNV